MSAPRGPGPHAGEGWCLCARPAPAASIFGGVAYLCGDCSGLLRPGDCRCVARGTDPYGIAEAWKIHDVAVRGVLRRAGLGDAEIAAAAAAFNRTASVGTIVASDPSGTALHAPELAAMNEAISGLRAPCPMPRCAPLPVAGAFWARVRALAACARRFDGT